MHPFDSTEPESGAAPASAREGAEPRPRSLSGKTRAGRRAEPVRRTGAIGLAALLVATGGCSLRVGSSAPDALPTMSQAESTREALARDAVLISSEASSVADGGGAADDDVRSRAAALAKAAEEQGQALGGVWEPWASAPPKGYPTATPVATASVGSGTAELVDALEQGVGRARKAALAATDADAASLYASITVSWSAALAALFPDDKAVVAAPRDASSMTEALSGERLLTYDAARYAMEEVAARTSGDDRTRAVADSKAAGDVVTASVALGGADTRLAAYAGPAAVDGASADVTWARQAWTDVVDAEVAGIGSDSGKARETALDAAVDAAERAAAWGASTPALPGWTDGATASATGTASPTATTASSAPAPAASPSH